MTTNTERKIQGLNKRIATQQNWVRDTVDRAADNIAKCLRELEELGVDASPVPISTQFGELTIDKDHLGLV